MTAAPATAAAQTATGPPGQVRTPSAAASSFRPEYDIARAQVIPATYTVRPGDSLSAIAGREYGNRDLWPALWWVNRSKVGNPDVIDVGQVLALSSWHPQLAWLADDAMAAIPRPPVTLVSYSAPVQRQAAPAHQSYQAPAQQAPAQRSYPATGDGVNWGAIAQCESGNDWAIDTGNGFYGGLQFTEQTWLGYGGGQYASSAQYASESEQITVAERVLAGQGIGAWPVCGRNG